MDIEKIERKLNQLVMYIIPDSFIYQLMRAYGASKSTINLLKHGDLDQSKQDDQVADKNKLFFMKTSTGSLDTVFESLCHNELGYNGKQRLIIVTDFKRLLAKDTKRGNKIDIDIGKIHKHAVFFEPLSPDKKTERNKDVYQADVKAAEKMSKLYDQLLKDNQLSTSQQEHDLNIFFSRLLFCFFAEDTEIFNDGMFTDYIHKYTAQDGNDVDKMLSELFKELNIEAAHRKGTPNYLRPFPFVNGGLFSQEYTIPKFTTTSRKMIIECGDIDWSEINLDIFGSMMQAVVNKEQRSSMGMHYTSLKNIEKVIEPLFLDELEKEFKNSRKSASKLEKLLQRLRKIRIFDPACGSGNFLIIAYEKLCALEVDVIEALEEIKPNMEIPLPSISIQNFYGIEIDDFAHEIATLGLSLSKIKSINNFNEKFKKSIPSLPLDKNNNIHQGNALRLDWENICPKENGYEIYIIGNPPYLGSSKQGKQQKSDMAVVFAGCKNYKNLDYIACWFLKGADYLKNTEHRLAFLTTKSICQGEQVAILWPKIFSRNIEIVFCYQPFKWSNLAKNNAGVTCSIIALSQKNNLIKKIYNDGLPRKVLGISGYLLGSNKNTIVFRRQRPLSKISTMVRGNTAVDGGHLLLSKDEKDHLVKESFSSRKFIKKTLGSYEFINGVDQWCLWVKDKDVSSAMENPLIDARFKLVAKMRNASKNGSTRAFANKPYRFKQICHKDTTAIIVPRVSSERRDYIPIGFIDKDIIVKDLANVIYDAKPWLFSLLTSQMHMAWVRTVAGRLESRYRYSAVLCYNTFPVPELSEQQKHNLDKLADNVLAQRENHSEKTLAQLYDPDKMPAGLKKAHEQLDLAVDQCYRTKPFSSDEERLECLFALYEEMIAKEKSGDSKKSTGSHSHIKDIAHKMHDQSDKTKHKASLAKNCPWPPKRKKHA